MTTTQPIAPAFRGAVAAVHGTLVDVEFASP